MPTILRFRGFLIGFFVLDHPPAHVHAQRGRDRAVFLLHCDGGQIKLREKRGVTPSEEAALTRFIQENRDILCEAWEALHGDARGA